MKFFKITRKDTGEILELAAAEDDQLLPPGYDETLYDFTPMLAEPTVDDTLEIGLTTPAAAETYALEKVDHGADEEEEDFFARIRRQMAVDRIWAEIQRLKLAQDAKIFAPMPSSEQSLHFPTLSIYAQKKNLSIPDVALLLQTRLGDAVRRSAFVDATLFATRDNIRDATTLEAKLIEAKNVNWKEQ